MTAGESRETTVTAVDPVSPDSAVMAHAGQVVRGGGLVAFPTETVYGLGANALDPDAVAGIYRAKGRPARNPLIVHVVGEAMRASLVAAWPPAAEALAAAFWPGPLTLVLPKSAAVPDIVTGGGPTVAIREPAHPVARALILAANCPVAAPSANRSNELSPTLAEHVLKGLSGRIDLLLDGGPCEAGIESTVIDLSGSRPRILRPGPLSRAVLEAVIGPVDIAGGHLGEAALPAPGMLAKHYSPKTPTILVRAGSEMESCEGRQAIVTYRAVGNGSGTVVTLPDDPATYAAEIYARLHELDDGRFDQIVIVEPPDEPAWAAVRDRLLRAVGRDD